MTVRYQLQHDGGPEYPVRDTWEEAADDATAAELAVWVSENELKLVNEDTTKIVRIR
jgi:hypothetical protein